jgi:hypothetical protein
MRRRPIGPWNQLQGAWSEPLLLLFQYSAPLLLNLEFFYITNVSAIQSVVYASDMLNVWFFLYSESPRSSTILATHESHWYTIATDPTTYSSPDPLPPPNPLPLHPTRSYTNGVPNKNIIWKTTTAGWRWAMSRSFHTSLFYFILSSFCASRSLFSYSLVCIVIWSCFYFAFWFWFWFPLHVVDLSLSIYFSRPLLTSQPQLCRPLHAKIHILLRWDHAQSVRPSPPPRPRTHLDG